MESDWTYLEVGHVSVSSYSQVVLVGGGGGRSGPLERQAGDVVLTDRQFRYQDDKIYQQRVFF